MCPCERSPLFSALSWDMSEILRNDEAAGSLCFVSTRHLYCVSFVQVHQILKGHPTCTGLQIDVSLKDETQIMLLERWAIQVPVTECPLSDAQTASTMGRLRLLMRSLTASTRLLPAATVYRMLLVRTRGLCASSKLMSPISLVPPLKIWVTRHGICVFMYCVRRLRRLLMFLKSFSMTSRRFFLLYPVWPHLLHGLRDLLQVSRPPQACQPRRQPQPQHP